jgi:molybdopterin synthase catalytic subunit
MDDSLKLEENRGMISITSQPIDTSAILAHVSDEACGATVLFLGTTRRWTGETETAYLEYEAYVEMATAKMQELADHAAERWPIKKLAMVHRIGRVEVQEASVAVAVSCPHRAEAFDAGEWLIDELKKQVPIWKKEWYAVQSPIWIHPSPAP